MTKTAIIYVRVSTIRQADDGLPVESQIEQCQAKGAALSATVLKVFRDDGISGRTTKRPGFEAAFEFCERNRVDLFICWSTSRFARNRLDAALHKRLLEKMGTRLVYASQEFGEGDDGWLAEAITEVIDEQYSRQIAKDTRRSMAKNAVDGFWNGGRVPFGFRSVQIGKRRRLEIEDQEAPVVKLVFRWCLDGAGSKEIATRLNASGISRRGKRWDKASVTSVLRSRVAIGDLVYRDRGKEIVTRSHAPIISEEDFMTAQSEMDGRRPRNTGGRARSEAVFSGILRCGVCGDAMTTESATGRGGVKYRYYNCRSFLKAGTCASRRVPVDELDEWLLAGILDKVFTPENLRDLVADLKASSSSWARDREERLAALSAELADVTRRLGRLYDAVEAGTGLNLADLAPRMRENRARQDALREQIARVEAEPEPAVGLSEHDVSQAAAMFRDIVESCDDPRRLRSFLSGIVSQAVILGDEVRVVYSPERIVNAQMGGSHCEVRWLPDLGSNQGPAD